MFRARLMTIKQDFTWLMLGMFAGTPPSVPLTYTYVGQAEAPQGKADVIDAKSGPLTYRLFTNAETGLPIMVSWQAPGRPAVPGAPGGPPTAAVAPPPAAGAGQPPANPGGPPPGAKPAPEQRIFFADYKDVDGLKLPFRVRRAAGADTTEETTFDRFRINAKVDPRRFDTTTK
jgi:hypothetical protein